MATENGERPKILCADDDRFVQTFYSAALSEKGFDTRICSDGMSLLEAFQKQPADLVVLDLQMPGLSGLEVLDRLRKSETGFRTPVIIVSAQDSEESITNGLSLGADDYIVKPVQAPMLVAKINMILKRRRFSHMAREAVGVGTIFNDRYEVVRAIANGGYSTVYYARDVKAEPQRPVALKVFREDKLDPEESRRFLTAFSREAYEHVKLDHPNIAKILDFGQAGGVYFMVMEYLDGMSLNEIVHNTGPMGEENTILLGYELAKAFDYLSKSGLMHRDVKPDNVIITSDGQVKLIDFGLSRRSLDNTLSLRDEFRGTPQFVSPEIIHGGDDVDVKTDIYSLGVTLFFCCSGVYPITGKGTIELLRNHVEQPPKYLADCAEVGPALADLVQAMLAKNPASRPSAAEIAAALLQLSTDIL